MQKKKMIVLVTAAGLLGTTAGAGASALAEKVSGILRKDVKVIVNGENTTLQPVYIKGQAYLPVRGASKALGYDVNYDANNSEIELNAVSKESADYIRGIGIIASITPLSGGRYQIEFLGKGANPWIMLTIDEKTVVTDGAGRAVSPEHLKAGMEITAEYGPIMALSFPGQSPAAKITVGSQRLIREDVIQSVRHTDVGWQVQFGKTKDGIAVPEFTLNAGKETTVLTAQGESVAWEQLKAGTKVRAYYGPSLTKSIPPQSPLFYLIVLPETTQTPSGKMTAEAAQAYRDLAWAKVADQASHIVTKPDEALVQIVSAQDTGVLATTEEQKKKLKTLQDSNGNLVTVTYHTDQDELIGPLTVAFDFETKTFIGFYIRK